MNKGKVLLMEVKQPFAHYREPKVMQDEYIPTLNLPTATTIAGMIIEFDKSGYNHDTFIKKTTSIIYGVKLDEVTIEQIKSVIMMSSLYMSSHIVNSLRIYPN